MKTIKILFYAAEGEITESDYQEVKSQRHDARVRINELESMIEQLEKGKEQGTGK